MFLCAAVKQHNNHKPQQSKGDVAVNAPGEGRVRTEPLVLGYNDKGYTEYFKFLVVVGEDVL